MAVHARDATQLSSSQRPTPLRMREDLVIEHIPYGDALYAVVKDPVGLKYFRLQPEQYAALRLLDGQRSLVDIRDVLQKDFPAVPFSPSDVQSLVADLHEKGLLVGERFGQGASLLRRRREERWRKTRQALMNPLFIRFPGWDPDRFLTRCLPYIRWMFHPLCVGLVLLISAASLMFLVVKFDDIRQRLPEFHQFFAWPNLVYLWGTMAGAKVLHEFGHGFFCKYFGSECHSMGVMLLVFSPTLYCDVTDSWMLRSKWRRIAIGAAGMYVEVFLAALAIFAWWNTRAGLINHLCLNVFFVSTVTTVIFNANPLLRYDGYYMLSDFLEIPNLRQKASRLFQETFAWNCLGIELPHDPFMPTRGKGWFVLYAVATVLYQWVVLFGITMFLYTVLKPYRLQSVGIALALVSMCTSVGGLLWSLYKLITMPRQEPLSRWKTAVTLSVIAGLIAAALFIPVPWWINAPLYLEPVDVEHVYAVVPGSLTEIRTEHGRQVSEGDVLAVLNNPDLEERVLELHWQVQAELQAVETLQRLDRPQELVLAEQKLTSLRKQLEEARRVRDQVELRAPIAGTVIAAPRQQEPPLERRREQLAQWAGAPLEPRNLGCVLEERTHVCSIAPVRAYRAVLLIDQADRQDMTEGLQVRLKLDDLPDRRLSGVIESVSNRSQEFCPPNLSNKHGGPLPTVSDSQGRERLTSAAFPANVPLDIDPELVRTGMRGNARVIVSRRSAWDWIWRWVRTTFKFRL